MASIHSGWPESGADRRAALRLPLDIAVRIGIGEQDRVAARSHNVSLGGMFVTASVVFSIGDAVTLCFVSPETRAAQQWLARVAHQHGVGVGLIFDTFEPHQLSVLLELLQRGDWNATHPGPASKEARAPSPR